MPDVAAGLFAAAVTLLGMVAALLGLVGSKPTIVSTEYLNVWDWD
jgi:calnexin